MLGVQGGRVVGSLEKQLDLGLLSLPGALGIGSTLPIPSFLFSSLLETMTEEAGEPLQKVGAGAGSTWEGTPRIQFL